MRLLIIVALVVEALVVRTSCAADAPRTFREEASKQSEIYSSAGQKVPEGYIIGRSLLSYAFTLSPGFRHSLAKLGAHDRWLDIGAGEGHAVLDYRMSKYDVILQRPSDASGKAQAIAMSIEDRRTPRWHDAAASLGEKQLRYVFGRRLREYSLEELGQFQLISDVLGAFSYSRFASVFMEKALGLLTVGGDFYTILQDVQAADGKNRPFYPNAPFLTEIVDGNGAAVSVCAWLKSISCVEVTCEFRPDSSPPAEVYHIRKICNGVSVPQFALVHFTAGTPPERRFQLKNAPPDAPAPAGAKR